MSLISNSVPLVSSSIHPLYVTFSLEKQLPFPGNSHSIVKLQGPNLASILERKKERKKIFVKSENSTLLVLKAKFHQYQ